MAGEVPKLGSAEIEAVPPLADLFAAVSGRCG
jgi:hypothetical protein